MLGDDARAAGRSSESLQYKQPPVRVSKTFQDSNIFGAKDVSSNTITESAVRTSENSQARISRISRTYQDSNIFGHKDVSSHTITDNAKREMQRPHTAQKRVITKPTEINEVFARDDKNAKQRLRKSNDRAFEPSYERSSPTKSYVNEFYGGHHTSGYDGPLLRPKTATSKSFTSGPKTAADVKWIHQQSNIFCDDTKTEPARQTPDLGKLLSAKSQWDSKDTFKRSSNLRKSEDLTNSSMRAFAQNKKRVDMSSDIFNVNPARREQKSVDVNARPQDTVKAKFTDSKNQDLRKTHHMFSDLLSHEDKTYTYKNSPDSKADPIRPTNLAWNDSRIEKLSPKKTEEGQTANDRKVAHLSSSIGSTMNVTEFKSPTSQQAPRVTEKALEKEMKFNMSPQEKRAHDMRSEVPFGQSSQNWTTTKPEPSATYDFDLSSIPKNMDMDALKKNFAGYHVIDLQADRNNLNGTPIGTGRVQIRASASHDLLKLKHDLKQQGITLASHQENHNKKSNYRDLAKINWHDQYLQNEEGRLKSDFATPLESKLRNLESEGDIFGNTQGVGKWDRNTLEKVPTSKTDNQGEQKAAADVVKTLNWKNSIKKVATTAKSGVVDVKEKYKPVRQSTRSSLGQPRKTK